MVPEPPKGLGVMHFGVDFEKEQNALDFLVTHLVRQVEFSIYDLWHWYTLLVLITLRNIFGEIPFYFYNFP